jgi:hypothetical protein
MGKQLTISKIINVGSKSKEDVLALSKNPQQQREGSMKKKFQLSIRMEDTKINLKQKRKLEHIKGWCNLLLLVDSSN